MKSVCSTVKNIGESNPGTYLSTKVFYVFQVGAAGFSLPRDQRYCFLRFDLGYQMLWLVVDVR